MGPHGVRAAEQDHRPGAGSAGDSIVAYCLGITKVDPIEHKLLFERFINEARALPDIDIDFDVNRREEVIQYLYRRYGVDHSAMVCNVITYRARSAVREVAKALAFPPDVVDRIAKALDTRDASEVATDLALDGEFGWLFEELGSQTDTGGTATDVEADPLVVRSNDNTWHFRGKPALRPDLAAAEARARDAAGDHDGRPYSESGWYPPRRPSALDQSTVQVRHEGWERQRYAGSPAVDDHEGHVAVDPESGMPVERRPRPPVVTEASVEGSPPIRPRNRWQWLLALCAEIDGFPPPRDPRRRHARDPDPDHRARPHRAGHHAGPGGDRVRQGGRRGPRPGEDRPPVPADPGCGVGRFGPHRAGHGAPPDLDSLPHDDPEVFASIKTADTVGVFQVESRAQMQALPKASPARFEDLVVQVAIIRPGPVQGNAVHPYLRRRAGLEEAVYPHPSLRPILEDTLGVILYQEQVMQIAITVCGYSATDADIFRKAMGSIGRTRPCSANGIGSLPAPYGPV